MCKVNEKYNVVGESGDEVWINRKGEVTEIKDMSGDYAKNALRQLIKKLRIRREELVNVHKSYECDDQCDDCCIDEPFPA